jgi:hypothetical protein
MLWISSTQVLRPLVTAIYTTLTRPHGIGLKLDNVLFSVGGGDSFVEKAIQEDPGVDGPASQPFLQSLPWDMSPFVAETLLLSLNDLGQGEAVRLLVRPYQ